jgi:hypothetical protein
VGNTLSEPDAFVNRVELSAATPYQVRGKAVSYQPFCSFFYKNFFEGNKSGSISFGFVFGVM